MDFNLLTLSELKNIAKEEKIKGVSGLKKDELVVVLEENEKKKAAAVKAETAAKSGAKKAAAKSDAAKKTVKAPAKAEKTSKTEEKAPAKASKTAKTAKTASPAEKPEAEAKAPAKASKTAKTAKTALPAEKPEAEAKAPAKTENEKASVKAEEEKAPVKAAKTVPVRSYDSTVTSWETVNPGTAGIRREGAPVRRPAPGSRPVPGYEQRPMARPAGDRQAPASRLSPEQRPGRPVGDQKPVAASRSVQDRPTAPQGQAPERVQVGTPENQPMSHAETLATYIAQNYALAGSPQDSGETKEGILEVMPEGFAFVRCDNFLPGSEDVYVSPAQIKRYGLKTGDYIVGNTKIRMPNEKFSALLYINTVNRLPLDEIVKRKKFEDLTPVFPNQRFHLETPGCGPAMRMVDLLSPIGKGQRGMIVSQPKAGKTTLLKQIAKALIKNHPSIHLIILLIDERPEEVTDMKESINGDNVEVIYSTFDEQPENHKRVSEMVIERARRLVEQKQDVVILLDSITRLARAYNLTVQASGRTLSGGLDPAALYMPKKFFGAARCMREGGSLTVLATALVETGSRMDDVVFEEFKGTGNMELVLDRNLSERRVFPAIDLPKSGTRREDLLLTPQELEASNIIRRAFNSSHTDEVVERIINLFTHTRNNQEFVEVVKKTRIVP
ncbi:MAG: transcription termination factor Rho [Lachnospiraceae bacterium]|nr:transcription termination factor Rho [Lachnospiraceae bacterium]